VNIQDFKFTASLKGMVGVHWFTVQDNEDVYVHCDDGDYQYRIKVPKAHPELKLMCTSAVLALESQVRSTRLRACRQLYGSKH
jgi:hypothetical protein